MSDWDDMEPGIADGVEEFIYGLVPNKDQATYDGFNHQDIWNVRAQPVRFPKADYNGNTVLARFTLIDSKLKITMSLAELMVDLNDPMSLDQAEAFFKEHVDGRRDDPVGGVAGVVRDRSGGVVEGGPDSDFYGSAWEAFEDDREKLHWIALWA